MLLWYVPPLHVRHALDPTAGWYIPAAQFVQLLVPPTEYVPIAHAVATDALEGQYVPAWHVVVAVDPAGQYEPVGQDAQLAAPVLL